MRLKYQSGCSSLLEGNIGLYFDVGFGGMGGEHLWRASSRRLFLSASSMFPWPLLCCCQLHLFPYIAARTQKILRNSEIHTIQRIRGRTVKFASLSRWKCCIPHCRIPLWSPSKYSPWEAMHRCQRLVHPSKQFWNWFCGMAFRAAVVLLLMSSMSSKWFPLFSGTEKKSLGARSGE